MLPILPFKPYFFSKMGRKLVKYRAPESRKKTLDRIDRNILRVLQRSGRISNTKLARTVNLSPTSCLERVRRLERDGYILEYVARLDPAKLDAALLLFVQVALDRATPNVFEVFRNAVVDIPEITQCHMVAGEFDYLLMIRVSDMAAYTAFFGEKSAKLPGVLRTHTHVVMNEVKDTFALPIPED